MEAYSKFITVMHYNQHAIILIVCHIGGYYFKWSCQLTQHEQSRFCVAGVNRFVVYIILTVSSQSSLSFYICLSKFLPQCASKTHLLNHRNSTFVNILPCIIRKNRTLVLMSLSGFFSGLQSVWCVCWKLLLDGRRTRKRGKRDKDFLVVDVRERAKKRQDVVG